MRPPISRRGLLAGAGAAIATLLIDACGGRATQGPTTQGPTTTAGVPSSTSTATSSSAHPSTTSSIAGASPSTASANPDAAAAYVDHGPADTAQVALTFHFAGDPQLVATLLDELRSNHLRCTLFAIGDWITANPVLTRRAIADGHELANHTKSHQSMLKLSRAQVRDEIAGGGQALVPFVGSIGNWFRPSGTDVPNDVILQEAARVGYDVSLGYDIDSRDYTQPGSAAVVSKVDAQMHPGAIVSLHFGHRDTIDALPEILRRITTMNLRPVTVTELLRPGTATKGLRRDGR